MKKFLAASLTILSLSCWSGNAQVTNSVPTLSYLTNWILQTVFGGTTQFNLSGFPLRLTNVNAAVDLNFASNQYILSAGGMGSNIVLRGTSVVDKVDFAAGALDVLIGRTVNILYSSADNIALGIDYSFTNVANTVSLGSGNVINDNNYGITVGNLNRITGSSDYASAFGNNNGVKDAPMSTTVGYNNKNYSQSGVVLGYSSWASNMASIAIGLNAAASNDNSVAIGPYARGFANNLMVLGNTTQYVYSVGGFVMPTNLPPSKPFKGGDMFIWNSNGTAVFILKSSLSDLTKWASTNLWL